MVLQNLGAKFICHFLFPTWAIHITETQHGTAKKWQHMIIKLDLSALLRMSFLFIAHHFTYASNIYSSLNISIHSEPSSYQYSNNYDILQSPITLSVHETWGCAWKRITGEHDCMLMFYTMQAQPHLNSEKCVLKN